MGWNSSLLCLQSADFIIMYNTDDTDEALGLAPDPISMGSDGGVCGGDEG